MRYRQTIIFLVLAAIGLWPCPGMGREGRLAVLPMEDLSLGGNGLNMAITQQVRDGAVARGWEVVSEEEIIVFMVKNRVRWLGHLGSKYVRRLQEQLGVDYLLLGSVNQRRDQPPYALGLTLQMVRSADGRIVWADNTELSGADEIGLLGVSQPRDMAAMEAMVVARALAELPAVAAAQGRPVARRQTIESVTLGPEILRPGDMVQCRLTVGAAAAGRDGSAVTLYVDGQRLETTYQKDENSFVASWPATATQERCQVSAVLTRPGGVDQEVLVGSYLVDDRAPHLTLQLKGQELNGMVVLQKNVVIVPVMQQPEPISRWQMSVRDKEGVEVMSDAGRHGLPDRFAWWGQAKTGSLVADGYYTIMLQVWDRAGNSATAQEAIRVVRREPKMVVAMQERDNSLALKLEYDGEIPLAYWRLEVLDQNGEMVSESSGTEVTDGLSLPLAAVAGRTLSYRLYAQDMLGNRLCREVAAMDPLQEEKAPAEEEEFLAEKVVEEQIWSADF